MPDIEVLAREAQVPLDDVAQLYVREWAALSAGVRITSLLPILTTRKVRDLLRQHGHPQRVPAAVEAFALAQPTPRADQY
jgi:Protein of unknown function (DUF3562)